MMLMTVPFMDRIGFDRGEVVGYTAILASFLVVFFGVRSYREQNGGLLTFGRGFAVGLLIVLISCAFYVATWELIYFKLSPDFMDKWSSYAVEKLRASGAGQPAIDAKLREMANFKAMYANPFINAAITFLEPFPIGFLVALVSAGVLRRKEGLRSAPAVPGVAR
jgi:hypothetical protein